MSSFPYLSRLYLALSAHFCRFLKIPSSLLPFFRFNFCNSVPKLDKHMRVFSLRFAVSVLLIFCLSGLHAQGADPELANQYFTDGEYEKAATLYDQLLDKERRSDYYFTRYIDCLAKLERWEEAEKAVKKQIKDQPENNTLFVVYGNILEEQSKDKEAAEQYQRAIDKMAGDYAAVIRLSNLFLNDSKYELAIKTFERGAALTKDPNRFAYNLGDLYRRKGDPVKMTEQYLNALEADPGKLPSLQTIFARTLAPEDFTELQSQLYTRIQQNENPDFVELLAWSFVQRKDFKSALRQYKALDKRLGESGQRVMHLADEAAEAKDFDAAIAGYEYVIAEKGQNSPFFYDAKREAMQCRRRKVTEGYNYTQQDLLTLESEYEAFLNQYGKTNLSASIGRRGLLSPGQGVTGLDATGGLLVRAGHVADLGPGLGRPPLLEVHLFFPRAFEILGRTFELPERIAERLPEFGQLARPEDEQRNDEDEEDLRESEASEHPLACPLTGSSAPVPSRPPGTSEV